MDGQTLTPELYADHVSALRNRRTVGFNGRTASNFKEYGFLIEAEGFDPIANGCEPMPEDPALTNPKAKADAPATESFAHEALAAEVQKVAELGMKVEDLEGVIERLEFGHIADFVQSDFEGWGCIDPGTNDTRNGLKSLWYGRPNPEGPVVLVFLADSLRLACHPTDVDAEGWVAHISKEHWASMTNDMGLGSIFSDAELSESATELMRLRNAYENNALFVSEVAEVVGVEPDTEGEFAGMINRDAVLPSLTQMLASKDAALETYSGIISKVAEALGTEADIKKMLAAVEKLKKAAKG